MTLTLQTVSKKASALFTLFSKELKNLSSGEFRTRLRETKSARLIDLSTTDEYKELHIPGSLNCDSFSSEFANKLEVMDKSRPYFIYCRNGHRSEAAMRLMEEMGFKRVYALASGLQSWKGTLERSY